MHATCIDLWSTSPAWALHSFTCQWPQNMEAAGTSRLPPLPTRPWPWGSHRKGGCTEQLRETSRGRSHGGHGWYHWVCHTLLCVLCINNGKWLFSALPFLFCSAWFIACSLGAGTMPCGTEFNKEAKMTELAFLLLRHHLILKPNMLDRWHLNHPCPPSGPN